MNTINSKVAISFWTGKIEKIINIDFQLGAIIKWDSKAATNNIYLSSLHLLKE